MRKIKLNRLNNPALVKKWILMLLQGISLVLLGVFLFFQLDTPIISFRTPLALIAISNGIIFILAYFISDPFDKSMTELIYGLILVLASLLIFSAPLEIPNLDIGFLTGYMLINALLYASISWYLRSVMKFWWVNFILPAFTICVIIFLFYSKLQNPILLNVLLGLQFLWCGVTIMIMAFDIRRLQLEFNKPISQFTIK